MKQRHSIRLFAFLLPVFFLFLVLPASTAAAQAPASTGTVSEFEVNGLKVILKQRPGTQTVAAGIFVRGGTTNIIAANAGIENLLLNVASDGTARYPRTALRAEMARMGSTIGYSTSYDYSVFSMACTREHFDHTWDIFIDAALRPSLLPTDVELEKQRIIAGLKGEEVTPDGLLQASLARTVYAGHPYSVNPDGTPETVAKLTPADLKQYHQKIMQTSHLLLVIVGDLDMYSLKSRVTAAFATLPRGDYKAVPVPLLKFNAPHADVVPRSLPSNYVTGAFGGPAFGSTDFSALQVAINILQDRVFSEVRVKRNLSYAPVAFVRSQGASLGGIYVTAVDVNQTAGIMLKEVTRIKKETVDADTLSAVVAQFVTQYYLDNETSAAQGGALARYELMGGGWRNAETLLERLRAVTPADVQRVSQQYMHNFQFIVVGDEKSVNKQVLTTDP
jgi:zinc protease